MTLIEKALTRNLADPSALEDAFEVLRLSPASDRHWNKVIRRHASAGAAKGNVRMYELLKRAMLFDAQEDFDTFCQYIEWDREPEKRFYLPRRKQLLPAVRELQRLAGPELDLLAISMPPGVGKTTLAIFYLCWMAGKRPELTNLTCSHNNDFLRGVYNECLRILEPDGEYLWGDVFDGLSVCGTNAKSMRIDVGESKRFETLEFTSTGAGNAGKVRATNLLYCDDLVEGIEQALSRDQMDKLWRIYTDDLMQRKQGANPKELHIATRWSVHDVIGRLERAFEGDPKAKFLAMPAMNEDDESNFDYPYGLGYSTAAYRKQREAMGGDASWNAIYMNRPIEREGQVYHPEELRRYFELPDREPDGVIAVCDTKDKGKDYCVLLVGYLYGGDCYIEDILCDNGLAVDDRAAEMLLRHNVAMAQFESNAAGGKIAEKVQGIVKERGGKARITTKYHTANKETRIIMGSAMVKERLLFKDDSVVKSREYRRAMNMLYGYTLAGKNAHDDVPDAVTMMVEYLESFEASKVKVFKRPF